MKHAREGRDALRHNEQVRHAKEWGGGGGGGGWGRGGVSKLKYTRERWKLCVAARKSGASRKQQRGE